MDEDRIIGWLLWVVVLLWPISMWLTILKIIP